MPRRKTELYKLIELVRFLRSPKGCPWDRVQTHKSLIPYLREEALEVEKALKKGKWPEIEDELGDLLLQVLLHADLQRAKGNFDLEDLAKAQRLKLIRRHPHVFGHADIRTAEGVLENWKAIKARERRLRLADLAARAKRR